jgi:hypothetical protein
LKKRKLAKLRKKESTKACQAIELEGAKLVGWGGKMWCKEERLTRSRDFFLCNPPAYKLAFERSSETGRDTHSKNIYRLFSIPPIAGRPTPFYLETNPYTTVFGDAHGALRRSIGEDGRKHWMRAKITDSTTLLATALKSEGYMDRKDARFA